MLKIKLILVHFATKNNTLPIIAYFTTKNDTLLKIIDFTNKNAIKLIKILQNFTYKNTRN
jgi:hypothetical protein